MMTLTTYIKTYPSGVAVLPLDGTGADTMNLGRAYIGANVRPEAAPEVKDPVHFAAMDRSSDGGKTWEPCQTDAVRGLVVPGSMLCLEPGEWPESLGKK